MAIPKTLVGARAKLFVQTGSSAPVLVGIFDSVNYSANISAEAIHTLGRYGTQEVVATAAEAITVDCSGFRVIGSGAYELGAMPTLGQLLMLDTVSLSVVDRQSTSGETIFSVVGCVPIRYSGGMAAKATSKISISYLGTVMSEDGLDQGEAGATNYPS